MQEFNTRQPARCDECTLNNRPFVPSRKSWPLIKQLPVLMIGQAPGEVEAITKEPFTGPAGKRHFTLCRLAGVNKTMIPHTTICHCYPMNDAKPTPLEIQCCLPLLKEEIHECQPKMIVALGDVAMTALTGLKSIQSQRGRIVPLLDLFEYKCDVLLALHPSFIMRQPQWVDVQVMTYGLIFKYLNGEEVNFKEPEFLNDPDELTLAEYLNDDKAWYGTDTETTGLDKFHDVVIGASFCKDLNSACAVYFSGPDDPRWAVCKDFLERDDRFKIWQNGSYDEQILESNGVKCEGFVYDTRLGQQLLSSDLPTNLDFLRAQYTPIPPYKPSKKEIAAISSWGKDRMLRYANLDALTTKWVSTEQFKLLSEKQIKLLNNLLIPLVKGINVMERRGVRVDVKKLAALYAMSAPRCDAIAAEFGKVGVNPRSPKQLKAYFQTKDCQEKTLLYHIQRDHPMKELMNLRLEYVTLHKMSSVYLKGIYQRLEGDRIHTTYNIDGTGTGRLSSVDPNLQNVPGPMREIYIPDEGHYFLSADYKQIELWVGAIIAKEDQMLKDLQDGRDVHNEVAMMCFPHAEEITKDMRLKAKTVVFGTFYGRRPYSIARAFKVSVAEAESWQLKCINKYPKLADYRRECELAFSRSGKLETPFGRTRLLQTVNQGYNFPVQSSASDITLGAIVEAYKDPVVIPSLTVHDEIVFQVPYTDPVVEQDHLRRIKAIMGRPIEELGNVRFKSDFERGDNWYKLREVMI